VILVTSEKIDADVESEKEGEKAVSLKHQSVLQSKLTRLAIQIGYGGTC